ncbi:MAG: hypothetical protein NVSMB9_07040 [Isosphaeraceae bacterium]
MKAWGRWLPLVSGMVLMTSTTSWGQALPSSARVETEPLDLIAPERYESPSLLVPIRKVTIVAQVDGVVRSQNAKEGDLVREGQVLFQFDKAEASASLRIAQAHVKEQKAVLDTTQVDSKPAQAARLEAAQAREELGRLQVDRCTLRAPFSGRILVADVSVGQFVRTGTTLAELADVSSLRALVPIPREGAAVGGPLTVSIDRQAIPGKIQALLPLSDSFAALREMACTYKMAWVVVPNSEGALEPGQRLLSPALPDAPIATIPAHALKKSPGKDKETFAKDAKGLAMLQVIRNEYVTDISVRVIGPLGGDRVQITGPLRRHDALIVSSSAPLLTGTLIRFNGSRGPGVEPINPNPAESGTTADVTPPRAGGRSAPIGTAGSAVPRRKKPGREMEKSPSPTKPFTKGAENPVPF